ncbi:MAG TPA: L,D-transpeptidase family protein [Bradyrhizobium sp.]|nr:L,D-transpeptidase family protein [Bradyrhizobium sp.]
MVRVRKYGASVASRRLWRVAVLAAAAAIAASSQAEAALYWSDFDSGFSQPSPTVTQRRPKPRLRQAKKIGAPQKEAGKPQGPLIIAISIQKQNLKIYDAKGFFAETPISTGMPGHPTPMGVFSVIQKHKLHHSNIYSGAPMPYMQRITWSGVAMHAGVLPGYPASHGCIRMPMAFAVKMWGWTRMGARVVVAPGEMTPADFSHPLLMAQKVVPQPTVANEPSPDAASAAKTDKASDANGAIRPAISAASLELRPTDGHDGGVKPVMSEPPAAPLTQTADARAALPATNAPVTMTDATSSEAAAPGETASSAHKPVETKSSEAAAAEIKSAVTGVTTQTSGDAVRTEGPAKDARTEAPKADTASSREKPDQNVKAVTDIRRAAPDVKNDQPRLDAEKAAVSKPDPAIVAPPKRSGQIAAFVSRKDSKLYVRQNFSPLFEVPVTIAPSDRPLGTHVFTAQVDKNDANVLHWSVISLPAPARYAEPRDEDERASRRRKIAGAAQNKAIPAPNSPAEALDRLTIPPDAMAKISEALSTGSSIIVSDQGISSGETGAGTDFIVSLR